MEVIEGIENLPLSPDPRGVCVGAFDGFHVGHQYLLSRLCSVCHERDLQSALVTFEPIPAQLFAPPDAPPRRLITREERIALANSLCCDLMLILRFDRELAGWSASRFINEVLKDGLHTRLLMGSKSHTMGHDRANWAQITEIATAAGVDVMESPVLKLGRWTVNSTQVRSLLWEGRVDEAAELLGRHYNLDGQVIAGRGVGRELGFPTANLEPAPEKLIPGDGVYAGMAGLPDGPAWAAAVSIGNAPTFAVGKRLIEAYLLTDEPLELVGQRLRLQFIRRLRDQKKFDKPDELARQIAEDVRQTRELCSTARDLFPGGIFCP